jgi:hypothetical protein
MKRLSTVPRWAMRRRIVTLEKAGQKEMIGIQSQWRRMCIMIVNLSLGILPFATHSHSRRHYTARVAGHIWVYFCGFLLRIHIVLSEVFAIFNSNYLSYLPSD